MSIIVRICAVIEPSWIPIFYSTQGSSSQGSVEVVHGGTRDRLTPNEASVMGTASDSSTSTATSASPDPREELNAIFEKYRGLIDKRGNIPMKTLDSTPIDPGMKILVLDVRKIYLLRASSFTFR